MSSFFDRSSGGRRAFQVGGKARGLLLRRNTLVTRRYQSQRCNKRDLVRGAGGRGSWLPVALFTAAMGEDASVSLSYCVMIKMDNKFNAASSATPVVRKKGLTPKTRDDPISAQ